MGIQVPGGGSLTQAAIEAAMPGIPRVLGPFVINFDDAGLVAGKDLYTPTVGDVLLDAWVSTIEAWDGTTPKGDIGTFGGTTTGLGAFVNMTMWDMTNQVLEPAGAGIIMNNATMSSIVSIPAFARMYNGQGGMVFTAAHPLKICISDTGATDGNDPGATQGIAHVYLVVATPAAP